VFELGKSLRQARERRGFELAEIERKTRIRSRYLRALEEEQFDVIPGAAYAKGFLRTYAGLLGLDADRFVDELTSRLPPEDDEPSWPAGASYEADRRRRLVFPTALAGLAVVCATGIAILALGGTSGPTHPTAALPSEPLPAAPPAAPSPRPSTTRPGPQLATLVLRASTGRCWIEADADSRQGRHLYFATLEQGGSLRFARRRIWLRLGAPLSLRATLNGRALALPHTERPVDVLVTPRGAHAI
jgi:transcriptional regulator with XRE-family HTH domain